MQLIKFKVFILCFSILLDSALTAQQQVSIEEARKVSIQALNIRNRDKAVLQETDILTVNRLEKEKHILIFEVISKNGQAILLSGSKACLPVLGYFTVNKNQSVFSDDAPDGLKDMLEIYKRQIALCFKNDTIRLYYQKEWEQLLGTNPIQGTTNGNRVASNIVRTEIVSPLLTTKWGQSKSNDNHCDSYNYYVDDTDTDCSSCTSSKCPAGCTAVAMAQVMRYWKHPAYLSNKSEQFDWCNMPDSLMYSSPNYIKERNAVARLIKDCGIAAGMSYCYFGGCQSMSPIWNAREALEEDFDYSTDAHVDWRWTHTSTAWKNKIKADLNNGRPVIYSALDGFMGHSFILHGYDSDDNFCINWGWIGNYNYWLTINDLSPGNGNTYTTAEHAIFELYPKYPLRDYCTYYVPLWQHYHNYYIQHGQTTPAPYYNVPKTFPYLESVDESIAQALGLPSSWNTIPSGVSTEYVAHDVIVLKPGFHAQAGSNFTARIEPCADCSSKTASVVSSKKSFLSHKNIQNTPNLNTILNRKSSKEQKANLSQNTPNPFDNESTIEYFVPESAKDSRIIIVDIFGRTVRNLFINKNDNQIRISNGMLIKGIYFYTLIVDNQKIETRKMIIR
ncbi:MAG: C10 family peptidase [Paludibacter sp.]|nr:C10 family peptidase [Paludibacter sp.]